MKYNFICGIGEWPSYLLRIFNALFPALASDTKGLCFEIKMCQILVVQQHKIDFEQTCFLALFHRVIATKSLTLPFAFISESCIRIKNNLKQTINQLQFLFPYFFMVRQKVLLPFEEQQRNVKKILS